MKRTLIVPACFLFLTLFISCEKKMPEVHQYPEKVHFVMAEVNPEDSICGQMDAAFKKRLEELSEGNLTVEIKYYGVLGDESQVIKSLMNNEDDSIQIARVTANLSSFGANKSVLLSIPYTFNDNEHFWKFTKSDIAEEILNEPYELGLGVKGLCYAQEGFRNFFSTESISSLKDLQGKKMRVNGQTLTMLSKSLLTIPVNIQFTNLYMALQTGKIDIAEQSLSNYYTNSFYRVAPYMIMDGHMIGAVEILISSKCWDSLSYYQQVLVKKAAEYASAYCKEISFDKETDDAIELITKGVTLLEVTDKDEWKKSCDAIIKEQSKDYPDLYNKIVELQY